MFGASRVIAALLSAYDLNGLQYCTRRRALSMTLMLSDPCVRRSLRAPYLADGYAMELLATTKDIHFSDLLDICSGLPQVHRTTVTADWRRGLSAMEAEVQLKCGFWTSLPHLLCVLAHPDEGKARAGAVRILQQYEAQPAEKHHPIDTHILCSWVTFARDDDYLH